MLLRDQLLGVLTAIPLPLEEFSVKYILFGNKLIYIQGGGYIPYETQVLVASVDDCVFDSWRCTYHDARGKWVFVVFVF